MDHTANTAARPARPLLAALGAVILGICAAGPGPGPGPELVVPVAIGVTALVAAGRVGRRGGAALALLALAAGAGARARAWNADTGSWRGLGGGAEWTGRVGEATYRLPAGVVEDGDRLLVVGEGRERTAARGTHATPGAGDPLRILHADEVVRLGPARSGTLRSLERRLRAWRRDGLDRLARWRDGRASHAAAALCFGDKSGLAPELTDLFARTGTRHLLAVSGLHVVLLAGALVLPLSAALAFLGRRLPGRVGTWCGRAEAWRVVGLFALVPIAGSGAPVMRAALVLALAQLAALLPGRRRPDGLSLWAAAALFELAVDPFAFAALGHRLSYCAALGLILGHRGASRLLSLPPGPPRGPWVERRRAFLRPFQRGLRATLAAALSAGLATLPLIWTWIGEVCPWDPLTTAAALPPLTVFLCASWAWLCAPLPLFEWVATSSFDALVFVLSAADRLPLTPLPLPPRPLALLACASACTLLALHRKGSGRGRAPARCAACAWAIALVPWAGAPERWRFDALDVGHGTSVMVQAPGGSVLVFDAGSRDRSRVARGALAPSLRAREVRRPTVVLSHDDHDHSGALGWFLERHPPTTWWGSLPRRFAERLPADCARADVVDGSLHTTWGPGARVALHRTGDSPDNEGSRVLALEFAGRRVLLCGDAEQEGLARMLARGVLEGPWDLVLLPHHGSDTVHFGPFLDATRPREVWISGSRLTQVVQELDRRAIPWRATCVEGPLRREFSPDTDARVMRDSTVP